MIEIEYWSEGGRIPRVAVPRAHRRLVAPSTLFRTLVSGIAGRRTLVTMNK